MLTVAITVPAAKTATSAAAMTRVLILLFISMSFLPRFMYAF